MIALTWIFAALAGTLPADDATIKVDAAKVLNRVSPLLYGSCIEDVNHEIYGGLCAQMIFGESFEEPPQALGPKGWTSYGGMWSLAWDRLRVDPAFGAKLVRDEGIVGDGTVSTTVVFADDLGGNAGLIVRVNEPRPGPDAWIGYEVSLSIKDQNVMLGRHRNNFTMLKAAPARIEVRHDHVLRVEMKGPTIRVFLDKGAEPVLTFDDGPNALPPGRVGLRTWGSRALFGEVSSVNAAGEARGGRFEARSEAGPERDLSGAWDVIRDRGTEGRFSWDADRPFNSSRSQKIDRLQGTGRLGIANRGLNRWGIAVRKGHTYSGRAYLRQEEFTHVVAFELQSGDGSRVYARQEAKGLAGDWLPRDFQLTSDADDPKARFAVMIEGKGKVWVDQVTLMPSGDDLFHGLPFRGDIGKALQEQGLTLLRYGGSMINAPAYRWKTMVGDRGKRPQYKGWWYPQSTNGFGIEEFVQFCRAAGFEAVVSINIEETPEDAADLIEYLNGPASSAWGKKRAENGHPEPYGLKYLEVGNEEATNAHYVERFHLLYEAMKPKDKNVQYIIGAWWEPDNPISKRIVQELGAKADLWDVHVGGDDPREGAKVDALFTRMRKLYEEWSPGTALKACILEENGGHHDLARALGHASVVNASQRHGDFVLIDCPANCLQPWKQNDNDWDQGQLFFTPSQVWGMPPYHAQKMASSAHLPLRVASEVSTPDLDVTATRDEEGHRLTLKVVNAGDSPRRAEIVLDHVGTLVPGAKVSTLTGGLRDVNSPDQPERLVPRESLLPVASNHFSYEFPARSYTVLSLRSENGFGRVR